jgi:hypothetical protein
LPPDATPAPRPVKPATPPIPTAADPPPAPSKIRIRIVSRPADATVFLDSKRLGRTPLDETVATEPGKHVIRLRRKGYALYRLDVALDADVTQDVALVPQR